MVSFLDLLGFVSRVLLSGPSDSGPRPSPPQSRCALASTVASAFGRPPALCARGGVVEPLKIHGRHLDVIWGQQIPENSSDHFDRKPT